MLQPFLSNPFINQNWSVGLRYGDEDNDEKEKQADTETRFKPLMDFLKEKLSQSIDKVTISNRLTTSPMAIVAPQHGWSGNLERMMAAQAYKQNDPMATYQMSVKKVLEINPKHPLIENLLKKVEADDKGTETVEIINTLYELTALRSGYTLKDPVDVSSYECVESICFRGYFLFVVYSTYRASYPHQFGCRP